jgi:two-component system, NarL family, sensor histidine kinase DegS
MKPTAVPLRRPNFWFLVIGFLGVVFLNYSQFLLTDGFSIDTIIGLQRYSLEPMLFLIFSLFAGYVFGLFYGIIFTVASTLAIIPRLFFSPVSIDVWFEVSVILLAAAGLNVWFESYRRGVARRQQMVTELEMTSRALQSYVDTIKENERRLSVLLSITTAVNELGSLREILSTAADKILEATKVDGTMIFLINKRAGNLILRQHRGVSEALAKRESRLAIGEGFNGWVARTGKSIYVEDYLKDAPTSRPIIKAENIVSMFIVPLTAREEVVGTLCVLTHSVRHFSPEEEQLLKLIGAELGIAVERAALTEEKQRVGARYQELFEKAHDLIWMQDMDGKILGGNKAAQDYTGLSPLANIGANVVDFLTPEGIDPTREVRRKLLAGDEIKQPYEQRILRKDGSEAVIMLTTSIINDEAGNPVFQHIARDVTIERKLADNLRMYARQITRAQEEERNRIARELHDDTIQTLIILARQIDEMISSLSKRSKITGPLEELRKEIEATLARMRMFIQDLRPPTLDYLGLLPALRELVVHTNKQQNFLVEFIVDGTEESFAPEENMLFYRIVQEALHNIRKHAEASNVIIRLNFNKDDTVLEIRDDGKGFVSGEDSRFLRSGKIGLASMQERAELLGGDMEIQSTPGHGTVISLVIPKERWKSAETRKLKS